MLAVGVVLIELVVLVELVVCDEVVVEEVVEEVLVDPPFTCM